MGACSVPGAVQALYGHYFIYSSKADISDPIFQLSKLKLREVN